MTVREYSGNAKATSLSGAISAAATSIAVADATGYPTGASGPFVITIDTGLAAEEKVLCLSRTGNTLTVSARGWDGTSAADHDNAAVVQHTYSATDAREANAHVNDSTGDPHPQYLTQSEADALFLTATEGDARYFGGITGGEVLTEQNTASTTYTDLTTAGPAATVTIGSSGRALVYVGARAYNLTNNEVAHMALAASGANTFSADDAYSISVRSPAAGGYAHGGHWRLLSGLAAGSTTFTAKYRVGANTGYFTGRRVIVIPL